MAFALVFLVRFCRLLLVAMRFLDPDERGEPVDAPGQPVDFAAERFTFGSAHIILLAALGLLAAFVAAAAGMVRAAFLAVMMRMMPEADAV